MPELPIIEQYPDLRDEAYVELYDFSDCWTRKNPDAEMSVLDVAAALVRTRGDISASAVLLGRSRRSVSGFVTRDNQLRDFKEDLEEEFVDAAETAYKKIALDGDSAALRHILQTRGRDRGYGTQVKLSGDKDHPVTVTQIERQIIEVANPNSSSLPPTDPAEQV